MSCFQNWTPKFPDGRFLQILFCQKISSTENFPKKGNNIFQFTEHVSDIRISSSSANIRRLYCILIRLKFMFNFYLCLEKRKIMFNIDETLGCITTERKANHSSKGLSHGILTYFYNVQSYLQIQEGNMKIVVY